jgi:hypothetical protein
MFVMILDCNTAAQRLIRRVTSIRTLPTSFAPCHLKEAILVADLAIVATSYQSNVSVQMPLPFFRRISFAIRSTSAGGGGGFLLSFEQAGLQNLRGRKRG